MNNKFFREINTLEYELRGNNGEYEQVHEDEFMGNEDLVFDIDPYKRKNFKLDKFAGQINAYLKS